MIEALKPQREHLDQWIYNYAASAAPTMRMSVVVLRRHVDELIRGHGSKSLALMALRHTEIEIENARILASR